MDDDRSWMYQKYLANGLLNMSWYNGVLQFVEYAFNNKPTVSVREGKEYISCPCKGCDNMYFLDRQTVTRHLLNNEFCTNYERWSEHGEANPIDPSSPSAFSENHHRMEEMLHNAAGPEFNWDDPNPEAAKFFSMLAASEEPLWEVEFSGENTVKCENHSILSAVTRCLSLKAEHQMSQSCFNGMMDIIKSLLPKKEKLPANFYQAKRLVQGLVMDYQKIDVCPNFCMLYYKDRAHKEKCDECGEERYEPPSPNKKAKRVPKKILRYLPITPRLQRLYMTRSNAEHMRWHKEGKRQKSGIMEHPADGEDWKQFDLKHPEFASELRNVRFGLSTDGFMPYNSSAAPYSCWPVFVFPYNLPPGLLMKEETMFLTLVLPGPKHPGRDIDICLEPLVDELQTLWSIGKQTYDVSRKENFCMKAALMWTVSDFPAYEMLSGWGTHGRLGCPICMGNTKSFRLLHGKKASWFDCHRCFLPRDHVFRGDRRNFLKNRFENDLPPPRLTGEEVLDVVNKLPRIRWGKTAPLNQIPGYGTTHHWQKKSIFWNLPYWSTLLIRHNIDMMHLEKNFADNLIYMILNISNKTKDNAKARQDLALYCNRRSLNLSPDLKHKPQAPYALTIDQRRHVLKWLKEQVKFPDGYASNWSRCVNLSTGTLVGVKSHDFHIFMERLLPAAFRDFVPDSVWKALCEISSFFREICAKELDPLRIEQLEKDIVVTLCKLEKMFPPGFFDSMEHLVIHVAYEARMGGPIGPRWMYSSERRNKDSRMMVTNKARVEGSIVEATLIKEIASYCSSYFSEGAKNSKPVLHDDREENPSIRRPQVFDKLGLLLGRGKGRILNENEYKAAHNYIILNSPELVPLLE